MVGSRASLRQGRVRARGGDGGGVRVRPGGDDVRRVSGGDEGRRAARARALRVASQDAAHTVPSPRASAGGATVRSRQEIQRFSRVAHGRGGGGAHRRGGTRVVAPGRREFRRRLRARRRIRTSSPRGAWRCRDTSIFSREAGVRTRSDGCACSCDWTIRRRDGERRGRGCSGAMYARLRRGGVFRHRGGVVVKGGGEPSRNERRRRRV